MSRTNPDVENLTIKSRTFVAVLASVISVCAVVVSTTWILRGQLSSIEQKLDAVSESNLKAKYWTRQEASKYHRDLEKTLQHSGLKIEFPPPTDPGDYTP